MSLEFGTVALRLLFTEGTTLTGGYPVVSPGWAATDWLAKGRKLKV